MTMTCSLCTFENPKSDIKFDGLIKPKGTKVYLIRGRFESERCIPYLSIIDFFLKQIITKKYPRYHASTEGLAALDCLILQYVVLSQTR